MRQAWLFGLVAFVCLLRKRRFAWAGAALALSASLRIFPLMFALPLLFKGAARALALPGAAGGSREPKGLRSRYARFGWGLAAGLAILVGASALPPGGPGR